MASHSLCIGKLYKIMIEVDVKCQYVQKNLNNCQSGALIKELLLREETLLAQ